MSDTRADVLLLGLTLEEREQFKQRVKMALLKNIMQPREKIDKGFRKLGAREICAEEGSEERERQQEAMDAISETMDELEKARKRTRSKI